MIQPGQVLGGKYRVEQVLGRGGMGVVVQAVHEQLGTRVAVKYLLRSALEDGLAVERFLREARASVRLKSEHVCRVLDVGTFDDHAPYIVMELLTGADLARTLATEHQLPVKTAVDYILQACEAVAEAHASGVIHRDLKPANLFLTTRTDGSPLIKVLDFGISKLGGNEEMSLTRTSTAIGSPGYMSPEQLKSARDVDARTDVWSLGIVLYELVKGEPPWKAGSITEMALRIALDPLPPLGVPVPSGFARVVGKALQKDPRRRYGSVAELAAAIAPFGGSDAREAAARVARVAVRTGGGEAPATAIGGASSPTTISGATGQSMSWTSLSNRRRQRLGIGVALGAVGLVLGVIGLDRAGLFRSAPAEIRPAAQPAVAPSPPAAPAVTMDASLAPAVATEPVESKDGRRRPRPKPRTAPVTPTPAAPAAGSATEPGDLGESRF